MIHHDLILHIFTTSVCFLNAIVAREAIVGGHLAFRSDIRYQALILMDNHESRCGGAIIGKRDIISAAHCFINENGELLGKKISVLVGTIDLEIPGVVIELEKITIPVEYKPRVEHSTGDIAILKLKTPLDIEKHDMQELSLPSYRRRMIWDHKQVKITGFGWDEVDEQNPLIGHYSDHRLRYADAYVLNHQECQYEHPAIAINHEKQLCAKVHQNHEGNLRRGVCLGDGGGPLVRISRVIIGVLSVIPMDCSERTTSGIYTRTSHYRNFILNAMINVVTEEMIVIYV